MMNFSLLLIIMSIYKYISSDIQEITDTFDPVIKEQSE